MMNFSTITCHFRGVSRVRFEFCTVWYWTDVIDIRQNIGPDTSKKVQAGSLFCWPGETLHAGLKGFTLKPNNLPTNPIKSNGIRSWKQRRRSLCRFCYRTSCQRCFIVRRLWSLRWNSIPASSGHTCQYPRTSTEVYSSSACKIPYLLQCRSPCSWEVTKASLYSNSGIAEAIIINLLSAFANHRIWLSRFQRWIELVDAQWFNQ